LGECFSDDLEFALDGCAEHRVVLIDIEALAAVNSVRRETAR
jgi:hypothetical protein